MSDLFGQFLASTGWGSKKQSRSLFDEFLDDMNGLASETPEERRKRELAAMPREQRMRALMEDSGLEGGLDAMPTNYGAWSTGQEPAKFSEEVEDTILPRKDNDWGAAGLASLAALGPQLLRANTELQARAFDAIGAPKKGITGMMEDAERYAEASRDLGAASAELLGRDPNLLEKGGASLAPMAAIIGASAVNPALGIAMGGLQAFGPSYEEGRERNLSPEMSLAKALPASVASAALEQIGAGKILRPGSKIGQTFSKAALRALPSATARELGGAAVAEGLTEAGQEAVSLLAEGVTGKDLTKKEITDRVFESWLLGTGMGGAFAGVIQGANAFAPKAPVAPQTPTQAGLPPIDLTEGQVPYVPVAEENPFLPGPQGTQAFLPAHLQMPATNEEGTPFGRFHEVEVPQLDLKPMDKWLNPFPNKGHALPTEALTEQLPVGMRPSKDTLLFDHMADRIAQQVPVPRKKPATEAAIDEEAKGQVGTEAHIVAAQEASKAANGILRHFQNEYMRLQHEYDSYVIEQEMTGGVPESENTWMDRKLEEQDDIVKAFYTESGLLPSVMASSQALSDQTTSQGIVDTSIRLLQQLPDTRIEELKQLAGTSIDRSKLKTLPKIGIVSRGMSTPDISRVISVPDMASGGDMEIMVKQPTLDLMYDADSVTKLNSKEWMEGRSLIRRLQDSSDKDSNAVLGILALGEDVSAAHVDAIEPVLNRHGYSLGGTPEEIRSSLSSFRNLVEGVPSAASFYIQLRNSGVSPEYAATQTRVVNSIVRTIASKRGKTAAEVWADRKILRTITSEVMSPVSGESGDVQGWFGVQDPRQKIISLFRKGGAVKYGVGDASGKTGLPFEPKASRVVSETEQLSPTGAHEFLHAYEKTLPEILSDKDLNKLTSYLSRHQLASMTNKKPEEITTAAVNKAAKALKAKFLSAKGTENPVGMTTTQMELIPGIFEYMAANGIVPDGADKRTWFELQRSYAKRGYAGPDGKRHYSAYSFLPRKVHPEIVEIFKKIFDDSGYKSGANEFDLDSFVSAYESKGAEPLAAGIDRSALPLRELTEKDVLGVEPMEEVPTSSLQPVAQPAGALPVLPPTATPQGQGNQSQKGPSSAQQGQSGAPKQPSTATTPRVYVGGFSGASIGTPGASVQLTEDEIIKLAAAGADPKAAAQREPSFTETAIARLHSIFFGKDRGAMAALRYKDPAVRHMVRNLWKVREIAEGARDAIVMGAQARRNAYAVAVQQYGEQQKAQGLPFGKDEQNAIKREVFQARLGNDSSLIQDPGIRQAAVEMWNFIDDQQRLLMAQPGMTKERAETIADSIGSYMHREYAAYHDKDWMKLAPKSEFFWRAVDRRAEQLIAEGTPVQEAYNEAQGKLLEHLFKTQFDATGLVSDPNSTGRMDMDAWKTRLGPRGLSFFAALDAEREADAAAARKATKAGGPAPAVRDDVEVFYDWVESERAKAIDRWNKGKNTSGLPMPVAVVLPFDRMLQNFQDLRQEYTKLTDKQIVQKALDEEDHPEIWRQLMGEITDPEQAAVITATTLAHDLAFGDMFNKILDEGLKTGVLTLKQSDVNRVLISGPGYGPMTKFGNQPLYATEDFAQFLNLASQKKDQLSGFTAAMGLMKFGLVADLPPFVRNVYGMIPMYVLSGHPLSDFVRLAKGGLGSTSGSGKSAAALAGKAMAATINAPSRVQTKLLGINTDSEAADLLIEAMKRGVIEPGAVKELTNVLEHYAKDSGLRYEATGKEDHLKNALLKVKNGMSYASRLYQSPDVFIKLLAWQKEINDLAYVDGVGAGSETTAVTISDRIKDQAAENIKNKFQTYGRLPKLIRDFSKAPLLANFVTFPAEMARNMYHAAQQTVEMARVAKRAAAAGDTEKAERASLIAAKRGVGLATAATMFNVMSHGFRMLIGMDEEEKESFSNLAMFPSSRNAPPLVIERDGTKFSYVDSSAQDPYTLFSKIYSIATAGNMDWDAKGMEIGKEIARTFGSLGIPGMSAMEFGFGVNLPDNVMDLGDTKRQYKTYINDYQPKMLSGVLPDELSGRLYRLYRNMGPSFLKNNAEAFARAAELGLDSKVGAKEYKISDWLMNLAGVRVITTDIADVLRLKGFDFGSDKNKLAGRVNDELRKLGPRAPFAQRRDVVKSFEPEWKKIYTQYATYVSDARKLGIKDKDIRAVLTGGYDKETQKRGPNLSDEVVNAMLRGRYVPYTKIKEPEVK